MPRKKRLPPICGVYETAQILGVSENMVRKLAFGTTEKPADPRFPEGVRIKAGWVWLEEQIREYAAIERPHGAAGHRK